ncbi:MAG TPA: helix-turn-helix domain-containing protein [Dermatophilaceae bacterium]|nr:helix-turn-helix domain-containing protein [Dermatophilaceae bacterium]
MAAGRDNAPGGAPSREGILDAALEELGRPRGWTLQVGELASALGMTSAALLRPFGSRDALLTAVLRRRYDLGARTGMTQRGFFDAFLKIVRSGVDRPGLIGLFAVMSTAGSDPAHPAHAFFADHYRDGRVMLARELRRLQEAGEVRPDLDPELAAALLIAAADGLQIQWLYDDGVDFPAGLQHLWRLLAAHPAMPAAEGGAARAGGAVRAGGAARAGGKPAEGKPVRPAPADAPSRG